MDDQAEKLRQLVRTVRQAATVTAGPPLLAVFTASDGSLGSTLLEALERACSARGITTSKVIGDAAAAPKADWQTLQLHGDYQVADHEFWQGASILVVVSHSDDESIVTCYKSLKLAAQHTPLPPLEFVVAHDDEPKEAENAAERLAETCKRFLLCSIAGTTTITISEGAMVSSVAPVVERLAMMAPVAHHMLHSPLAVLGE